MRNNKAHWIAFGLISVMCLIIYKNYLTGLLAYLFYDISSDGFYLAYPSFCNLTEYIQHTGVPRWSFKMGMGQNLFPFILRDPFNIILYLGGKERIASLLIYAEVIKIVLAGVIFSRYLKVLQFSDYVCVTGALMFSFCGFMTEGSPFFVFTFEAFNFALLLLAFELLFMRNKWYLFPFAIFLYCISMPFNLYLYGLFLGLYAAFRFMQTSEFNLRKLGILYLKMLGLSVIGILLSGPMFLEITAQLFSSTRGNNLSQLTSSLSTASVFSLPGKLEAGTYIMRFFSNDVLGAGSNYKGWANILEAPLLYCSLPCLLLLPQTFGALTKRTLYAFITFLALWLIALVFPWFRHAYWLFLGDYFRAFSFFIAFVFILYSLYSLENILQAGRINKPLLIGTVVVLLALLFVPLFFEPSIVNKPIQVFTAAMLVIYTIVLALADVKKIQLPVRYLFFILLLCELTYTGWYTANKKDAFGMQWLRENKVLYNDYSKDAVEYAQANDPSFYRIDRYIAPGSSRRTSLNFSLAQGCNGTSGYNSFNQKNYVGHLQFMGIADKNNWEEGQWAQGLRDNPLLEVQNRVKYFINLKNVKPNWPDLWDSVASFDQLTLYKNKMVLPFGYTYDHVIKEGELNAISPDRRQYITMQAAVIRDADANKITGIAAFKPDDTAKGNYDINTLTEQLNKLSADTLNLEGFSDNEFTGNISLNTNKIMYLTIPFDDGWHALVDGKEQEKLLINGGMTGIFLEKGKHHVSVIYKVQYKFVGLVMSVIGIAICLVLYLYLRKFRKNKNNKIDYGKYINNVKAQKIAAFICTPLIIYFYFLQWKNVSIHDDDLNVLRSYEACHGFLGKINLAVSDGIFRPLQGLAIFILKETFHYNLGAYYLFNVAIQSINTLLLARILNLFLKSPYISLVLSFTFGLSRLCYYNMTQLYGGGALEGLAMIFFLLFLHSLLFALLTNKEAPGESKKQILYSLLFANLCIYTHERYLILFPFLILVILFAPTLRALSKSAKTTPILLSAGSFCLPLLIRQYVLSIPIFMGTGYTSIKISLPSVFEFFRNALFSIFQVNPGPEYLTGITFASLSFIEKGVIVGLLSVILILFIAYLFAARTNQEKSSKDKLVVFLSLFVLFGFLLGPALVQIRVELRWLQASLASLVIMIAIATAELKFVNNLVKNTALACFSLVFTWTNYIYLTKGAMNLYFSTSARVGAAFDQAIKKGIIHKNATRLYLWESHRIPDRESEINWALMGGYFFNIYEFKNPQIVYLDSIYQKTDSGFVYSMPNFKKDSEQVIHLKIENDNQTFKYYLKDITNDYLKDSLKSFKE